MSTLRNDKPLPTKKPGYFDHIFRKYPDCEPAPPVKVEPAICGCKAYLRGGTYNSPLICDLPAKHVGGCLFKFATGLGSVVV